METTREDFERRRTLARTIERREGRVLAGVAVSLGLAQLAFLKWGEGRIPDARLTAVAGLSFLAYMALVVFLIGRMMRRVNAARPVCGTCGVTLKGMAERVAGATGRCDACGQAAFR